MTREEAIKTIRLTCPKISDSECNFETAMRFLIPELAESEDERIRKALIDALTVSETIGELKYRLPYPTREECIAYLEKQKDASKAIEAVDRIDKYIDEHLANAHDMKDSNPDKKYYRGWDDALGKMAGILQDVYSDEKQKEQKPTDRFKEAREKYQVEWSEEDEHRRKDAIYFLESAKKHYADTSEIEKTIAWLKSLRPVSKESLQSHWKPSEEQMDSLRDTIVQTKGYSYSMYLPELYEQLKKLM